MKKINCFGKNVGRFCVAVPATMQLILQDGRALFQRDKDMAANTDKGFRITALTGLHGCVKIARGAYAALESVNV